MWLHSIKYSAGCGKECTLTSKRLNVRARGVQSLMSHFCLPAALQVRRPLSLQPSWATATAPNCWPRLPRSARPEAGSLHPATTLSGTPATRLTPHWDASFVRLFVFFILLPFSRVCQKLNFRPRKIEY